MLPTENFLFLFLTCPLNLEHVTISLSFSLNINTVEPLITDTLINGHLQ
jgi:hypothetical protein